ncbi:Conserved_hypothetical protein [Hexamita inflata]|uniref:TAFII55 protein conserved region domain-containing protein n=2 Tax=Hexamita inflata TaxID=28002 RepID=A0AA86P4R4_9EUKA|nr:Conserved hypothetical protein [Hexamita inflata]CAI9925521.1 Conserved hypothetical protein [Hexamita inflata]CAI9931756.1 Conserved hypothetical protein [Hexamita inflata]CAI9966241.1 Conserved hypothetical protein [Hexamita inflata]
MTQEQYVLELPPELTAKTEDPAFEFDLLFDESGTSGRFINNQTEDKYIFRTFTLPLVTESFTSTSGDIFFKNADVSQIILVYDPLQPPQILKDYEQYQQIQLYKMSRGAYPTGDVSPHGLTPPSKWAPLQLYPQFPVRPKFSKPVPVSETTLGATEDVKEDTNKTKVQQQLDDLQAKLLQQKEKLFQLEKSRDRARADGNLVDENEIVALQAEIEKTQSNIDKNLKLL